MIDDGFLQSPPRSIKIFSCGLLVVGQFQQLETRFNIVKVNNSKNPTDIDSRH